MPINNSVSAGPCTAVLTQSQSQQTQRAFVGQSLWGRTHNPALTSSLLTMQVLTLLTLPVWTPAGKRRGRLKAVPNEVEDGDNVESSNFWCT